MAGWPAALRVARREARRAGGRSALVIAMIALPVAAMAFASITYDTFTLRPDDEADRLMGAGQAAMRWPQEDPRARRPRAAAPTRASTEGAIRPQPSNVPPAATPDVTASTFGTTTSAERSIPTSA